MKQTAPIVIAEKGDCEGGRVECAQVLRHRAQLAAELLRLRGQHIVQQEEIHGVYLVIGGLFEVAAIVPHLGAHLLSHETGAEGGPLPAQGNAGNKTPSACSATASPRRWVFGEK